MKQQEILDNLGFEHLNRMQNASIKATQKHDNTLLLAPTGSGKTAAYLLSILPKLENMQGVQVIILAPTRELALQIDGVIKKMRLPLKSNICYGGHSFSVEKRSLKTPPTLLIGTPGRILDHMERGSFESAHVHTVVFDEFDKALEIGFSKEMEGIVSKLDHIKTKILVSATQSIEVPEYIQFDKATTLNFSDTEVNKLTVLKHVVPKDQKLEGLLELIKQMNEGERAIVFVNHREMSDRIGEFLSYEKVDYAVFHGGLEQDQRELGLTRFRNGSAQVLIATDIAARGIDIEQLDYVIHYQLPPQESVFTHRNGRTARMQATGTSILLMTELDYLPEYLDSEPENMLIDPNKQLTPSHWNTIYVNRGKKHKVNKMDFVGYILSFDFMSKEDLGLIEVQDFSSLLAIKRDKCRELISATKGKKIKNKSARFYFASI